MEIEIHRLQKLNFANQIFPGTNKMFKHIFLFPQRKNYCDVILNLIHDIVANEFPTFTEKILISLKNILQLKNISIKFKFRRLIFPDYEMELISIFQRRGQNRRRTFRTKVIYSADEKTIYNFILAGEKLIPARVREIDF